MDQRPTRASTSMASKGSSENQARRPRPRVPMTKAASSGPSEEPALPAHLEDGLGQPAPAAGRQVGDARGLRVEDGRTGPGQRHGDEHQSEAAGKRQQQQARQGEAHAHDQQVGLRPAVGGQADAGLQQGGGELEDKGDQPDLGEAQGEGLLDDRVQRGDQRLDRVVEQVRGADRQQDGEDGVRARRRRSGTAFQPLTPLRSWRAALGVML